MATTTTMVMVRPSKTFGTAEHIVSVVNKSIITDSNGDPWVRGAGYSKVKVFRPGETHYILPPYHEGEFLQPGVSATYQFATNTERYQIGKTFYLELADDSRKIFAKTEVTISQ